jgi:hypothetical protein
MLLPKLSAVRVRPIGIITKDPDWVVEAQERHQHEDVTHEVTNTPRHHEVAYFIFYPWYRDEKMNEQLQQGPFQMGALGETQRLRLICLHLIEVEHHVLTI